MKGMTVAEYTFKSTLATKSAIKIDGITVQIDPKQLTALRMYLSMSSAVIHQPSLIHHCCLESHRSQCWLNILMQDTPEIPEKVQFLLDGCSLLQHIPWK